MTFMNFFNDFDDSQRFLWDKLAGNSDFFEVTFTETLLRAQ